MAIGASPEQGQCAVDLAANSDGPGVFDCTRAVCDNPNATLLASGLVYRDTAGNLWRPDIWPAYCALGKLAGLREKPYVEVLEEVCATDAPGNAGEI